MASASSTWVPSSIARTLAPAERLTVSTRRTTLAALHPDEVEVVGTKQSEKLTKPPAGLAMLMTTLLPTLVTVTSLSIRVYAKRFKMACSRQIRAVQVSMKCPRARQCDNDKLIAAEGVIASAALDRSRMGHSRTAERRVGAAGKEIPHCWSARSTSIRLGLR